MSTMTGRLSPGTQRGYPSDDNTENEPCQCRRCVRARARDAEVVADAAALASSRISADAAAARARAIASIEAAYVEAVVAFLVPQGSFRCLSNICDAEGRWCPCSACCDQRLRVAEEMLAEATLLTEAEESVAEGAAAAVEAAAEAVRLVEGAEAAAEAGVQAARLARAPEPSAPAHTARRLPPVRLQCCPRAQGRRQVGAGRAAMSFR